MKRHSTPGTSAGCHPVGGKDTTMVCTPSLRAVMQGFQHSKTVFAAVLCATASFQPASAQVSPATILQVEIQNRVRYVDDVFDVSKLATNPNAAPAASARNFNTAVSIGDIVSVNGQAAQGTMTTTTRTTNLRQAPNSGEAIADTIRSDMAHYAFEILSAQGTPIGTIMGFGVGGGAAPPGSTSAITQGNNTIVGGTGAFLGARGNLGQLVNAETVTIRAASGVEDPVNRRKNGGGRNFYILQIIPLTRPQILSSAAGPAIAHSGDFSLVTPAKPAA